MGDTAEARRRLFVAIPLPDRLSGFVRRAQEMLPRTPGLRLMRPDQLHLTLAFIGEVGERKATAAQSVVESVPAGMGGEGQIERFLFLPAPNRARVVALDIRDSDGVFASLFERVMGDLEREGVMEREKRPFHPHLTIARLRNPAPVQPRSESGQAPFAIESVCLYESELKREGAVYTVLARAVLERSEARETA